MSRPVPSPKRARPTNPGSKIEWTSDVDGELTRLAAKGLSAATIAAELGTTRSSVAGRCHRLGVKLNGGRTKDSYRRKKPKQPEATDAPDSTPTPTPTPTHTRSWRPGRAMTYRSAATNSKPQNTPADTTTPVHLIAKSGTVLHVYARVTDQMPVASFDKKNDWWVLRPDPSRRFRTAKDAARAVAL